MQPLRRRLTSSSSAPTSSSVSSRHVSDPTPYKLPIEFWRALGHCGLRNLDEFKERFLANEAFLAPWADFRDSFLLLQPADMPVTSEPGSVQPEQILQWYTFYDEGEYRIDPTAPSSYFDTVIPTGPVDKTTWAVEDYEKHLYCWLLQTFKVGKSKNPHGIRHFECAHVITIWRTIFIPIITAIKSDYDIRGRRFYGELATFIEGVKPSGLAFPEQTVGIVAPKKVDNNVSHGKGLGHKKLWEDDKKELRTAYPQYGQVVEKPKVDLKSWIAGMKAKREQAKVMNELLGNVKAPSLYTPQDVTEYYHDWLTDLHRESRFLSRTPMIKPSPVEKLPVSPNKYSPSKSAVPRAGFSPAKGAASNMGSIGEDAPPQLPTRNPMHLEGGVGASTEPFTRIVSKENIRSALSLSSSEESLFGSPKKQSGSQGGRLNTFNTHMFPRRHPEGDE